jgi:hypothetical protein
VSHIVAVTVPATSHDLTTVAAMKAALGIPVEDTSKDAALQVAITRASAVIEAYLGRAIGVQTITEQWFLPVQRRNDTLVLDLQPVISIASLNEDDTDLVAEDYVLEASTGIIYRLANNNRTRWGYQTKVVYDAGYATVPADIETVCIELAASNSLTSSRDPAVRREITEGVGETEYFDRASTTTSSSSGGLDALTMSILAPYKRIVP